MVDLERRVLDAELLLENSLELAPPPVAVLSSADEHMGGESREPGRDRPDVEVVHLDDARGRGQALADRTRVDASGRPFQENRGRVPEDRPRARERPAA